MNEEGYHSWATTPACAARAVLQEHSRSTLDYEMVKQTNYERLFTLCPYDWRTEGLIFLPFNLLAVPLPGTRNVHAGESVVKREQAIAAIKKGKNSPFFSRKRTFAQVPVSAGRLFVPLTWTLWDKIRPSLQSLLQIRYYNQWPFTFDFINSQPQDGVELAHLLEGKSARINTATNSEGQTPLHLAVELDAPECVRVCLEHGAEVRTDWLMITTQH